MVYSHVQLVCKLLLFYIKKYLIIAETADVMADTIFLKTEQFSLSLEFGLYLYQINSYGQGKKCISNISNS